MDYFRQIDKALKEYEDYKPYPQHSVEWIANRITWCWKFRKITEKQKNDFCDRTISVIEIIKFCY